MKDSARDVMSILLRNAGPTTRTAHKANKASTPLGKSSPTVETEVGALAFTRSLYAH